MTNPMYQEPGGANRGRSRSGTMTPVVRSKSPLMMMADEHDDEEDELFVITQVAVISYNLFDN